MRDMLLWSQAAVGVMLLVGDVVGCARSPEQEAMAFVRRLGGRADSIRRLDLAQTAATDGDLEQLAAVGDGALVAVEELDLTRTRVTDHGLVALRAFSGLTKLTLTLTGVSDEGLAALEPLERLADLALIETGITDAAVEPLSRLTGVRRLVLMRTGVSAAGIARLRQSLPEAEIHVEPAAARARRAAR
jgi:hypothetical protein